MYGHGANRVGYSAPAQPCLAPPTGPPRPHVTGSTGCRRATWSTAARTVLPSASVLPLLRRSVPVPAALGLAMRLCSGRAPEALARCNTVHARDGARSLPVWRHPCSMTSSAKLTPGAAHQPGAQTGESAARTAGARTHASNPLLGRLASLARWCRFAATLRCGRACAETPFFPGHRLGCARTRAARLRWWAHPAGQEKDGVCGHGGRKGNGKQGDMHHQGKPFATLTGVKLHGAGCFPWPRETNTYGGRHYRKSP